MNPKSVQTFRHEKWLTLHKYLRSGIYYTKFPSVSFYDQLFSRYSRIETLPPPSTPHTRVKISKCHDCLSETWLLDKKSNSLYSPMVTYVLHDLRGLHTIRTSELSTQCDCVIAYPDATDVKLPSTNDFLCS